MVLIFNSCFLILIFNKGISISNLVQLFKFESHLELCILKINCSRLSDGRKNEQKSSNKSLTVIKRC